MSTRSRVPVAAWLAAVALGCGVVMSGLVVARGPRPIGPVQAQTQIRAQAHAQRGAHPGFTSAPFASGSIFDTPSFALAVAAPVPPAPPPGAIPPLSPLESGPFVNFDSPMVRPLALADNGAVLLATDTPDNSLMVYDTVDAGTGRLRLLGRVPVGLDPVAVAVQPGSPSRFAWVANFISDDVSVVDIENRKVVAVIPVGDEPVNILFDQTGSTAFVVTQGPSDHDSAFLGTTDNRGYIVAIKTATRQVQGTLRLECNTPRAAAYDPANQRLIVAALHAGNDTTVVGRRVRLFHPGNTSEWVLTIQMARDFSVTAPIFSTSTELAPWPDPGMLPGSPAVHRIVDSTPQGAWADIVDAITLSGGGLDPAVVATFAAEFNCTNPEVVLQAMASDAALRVDHDVLVVDVTSPSAMSVVQTVPRVGTTIVAMAKHPVRPRVLVADLHPRNLERLETTINGRFLEHRLTLVDLSPIGVQAPPAPFDLHGAVPNFDDASQPNPIAQEASLANPVDIVFDPSGTKAYVASLGADRVGVVNPATGDVLARVDVGRGPRGLALDDAAQRLYCLNRTDMTISVLTLDQSPPVELGRVQMFNPEPRDIREGRNFLYTAKIANNFSSSCAMCHIDGDLDHLAWDLGDPHAAVAQSVPSNLLGLATNHPVKGPMVTMSLKGLANHETFHWRGDKKNFGEFNGAFVSLLGGRLLTPEEMDQYTKFTLSLAYAPNPFYDRLNVFKSPLALAGGAIYVQFCNGCHAVDHDGTFRQPGLLDDFAFDFIGPPLFLQVQEITQMRGLYKKFPSDHFGAFGLLHDGSETSEDNGHPLSTFLEEFFPHGFDGNGNATGIAPGDHQKVIDFCASFQSNVMGVVGWQVLVQGPLTLQQHTDINWMVVQSRLAPSQNDVVASGFFASEPAGFVLLPPTGDVDEPTLFARDNGDVVDLDDMLAANPGTSLVFMAAPPGSGKRIGIDWDLDCILNRTEVHALQNQDYNADGIVNPDDLGDYITDYFTLPAVVGPAIYAVSPCVGESPPYADDGFKVDITGDCIVNPDDLGDYITAFYTPC